MCVGCVQLNQCYVADSDLARLDAIRAALPALRHRRPETYRWPAP